MRLNTKRATAGAAVVLAATAMSVLGVRAAHAQGGTDVWVVPLIQTPSQIGVGTPRNLTNRPGYDNQPAFTATGRSVLYTSIREDAQSDIWRVSVDGGAPERVTRTTESEYSATLLPDGSGFSVVRVDADSGQRLWAYAHDGTLQRHLAPGLEPVGYHVWTGEGLLGAFVLGEPNALAVISARGSYLDTLDRGIARALVRIPDTESFSYVRAATREVMAVDLRTTQVQRITQLPPDGEFHVWTREGALIASEGSRLLVANDDGWMIIADFTALGIRNITRLALSPGGDLLAFVADDASQP